MVDDRVFKQKFLVIYTQEFSNEKFEYKLYFDPISGFERKSIFYKIISISSRPEMVSKDGDREIQCKDKSGSNHYYQSEY